MIAPSFIDEMNTDFCGDFFDNMDDILDFPIEDVEGGANNQTFDGGVCAAPSDALTAPSSFSPNGTNNNNSVLSSGLDIPNDDIAYLEWLSNFMEDSFSPASITLDQDTSFNTKASQKFQTSSPISVLESSSSCSEGKPVPLGPETFISHQFQTSSPVSVLESSSSCSEEKPVPLGPETFIPGRGRPRTKRERPLTFKLPSMIHLTSPTFSTSETSQPFSAIESSSECEYFAESHPSKKVMKSVGIEQKKKKKKLSFPPVDKEMQQYCSPQPNAVRKCLHCEITKTPQWRAGPMGPKTLCNACGVRYKSGRLFPEYRPAASPTFVSSVHSNSHKKVLEMRNKVGDKTAMAATTPPPEMIPKNSNFLDYI